MWSHGVLIESAITVWQGVIAGLAGGVAMALAMAALSSAVGEGPWQLPQRLAATVLGEHASNGGIPAIVLGYAIHFALAAGFGAVFSVVASRLTHEFWMTALAYSLTLWVFNYWGAAVTPGGRATMQHKSAWLGPIAHIAYGGAMAAVAVMYAAGMHGA